MKRSPATLTVIIAAAVIAAAATGALGLIALRSRLPSTPPSPAAAKRAAGMASPAMGPAAGDPTAASPAKPRPPPDATAAGEASRPATDTSAAAAIEGRVSFQDGAPAGGVEVVALPLAGLSAAALWELVASLGPEDAREAAWTYVSRGAVAAARTATAEDSVFRLPGLAPGAYIVEARAPVHLAARSDILKLGAGDERRINLLLPAGLEIAGTVLGAAGEPLAGALIEAVSEAPGPAPDIPALVRHPGILLEWIESTGAHEARVEPDGAFRLRGLAAGRYRVTASAAAYGSDALEGVEAGERELAFRLPRGVSFSGRAVFQDGRPAVAARVKMELEGNSREGRESATTDTEGGFRFASLRPGQYALRVEDGGIQPEVVEGVRVDGFTAKQPLTVIVKPGEAIAGTVADGKGRALAHLRVQVEGDRRRDGRRMTLETDVHGRFLAAGLQAAPYKVRFPRQGGHPETIFDDIKPGAAGSKFTLERGSTLAGRVVDAADASGIAAAEISIDVDSSFHPPQRAFTDGEGRFELRGAPAGKAAVEVRGDGYLLAGLTVELRRGEELIDLRIEMERAGSIEGVVKTAAGDPVDGARVGLTREVAQGHDSYHDIGQPVVAAGGGAFRLPLSHGAAGLRYRVQASRHGLVDSRPIEIVVDDPTRTVSGLVLTMRTAAAIRGAVRSGDAGVAQVRVWASCHDDGDPPDVWFGSTVTDPRGGYAFRGLPAGEYSLNVEATGFAPGDERVAASEGEETVHDIELRPESVVAGRVLDPEGRPVGGALVSTMPFSGKGQDIDRRAIADQNGRYRLGSLTGGTHALLCAREGYTSEVLDVEAGRDDVDFVLTRAGTLAATVTDAETGAAVAEFEAELLPGTAAEESDGTGRPLYAAGPEGMLEASGLSPGAYRLLVRSRGRLTQVSPVEVRSGETARVEIALHRGAEIAGVVVDARGLPVARAILRATALAGKPEETAASPDRRSPREYSAEDGTFRITGLADGLYRVEARHSRYATGKSAPVAAARGPGAPAADVRIVLPDRQ